jgi:hypothetical protein
VHAQVRAIRGGDAGRILATVLEHGQAVVQRGCDSSAPSEPAVG